MKRIHALIVILVLLVSGCSSNMGQFASSKLPEHGSTTTGVLAIAMDATNRTSERFAYYYAFVSDSRPGFQFNVRLWENRKVAVIQNLMPGQYTLTGIKVVSEPSSTIRTYVAPDIRQLNHPISFTISPGTITILDYGVVADQVYPSGFRFDDDGEIRQTMQVKLLSPGDRQLVLRQLSRQENPAAWTKVEQHSNAGQLPEVAYTDSSKAYVSRLFNRFDDW